MICLSCGVPFGHKDHCPEKEKPILGLLEEEMTEIRRIEKERYLPTMINHPDHYTAGGIECIDALRSALVGYSGFAGFCAGNAIKHIWRAPHKGTLSTDLEKAVWYLNRLIDENIEEKAG
jgi:hypothetical protein